MKPVKVKTVQVKAGQTKLASAGPSQPVAPPITSTIPARPEVAETSSAVVANVADARIEAAKDALRAAMPQQPAGHGTGHGLLGVLPASSLTQAPAQASPHAQTMAYADPAPRAQPAAVQQNEAVKPAAPAVVRTGWIVQVGALESESEAKQRIDLARNKASALLSRADPFTETTVSKDKRTLYRGPLRRPRPHFRRSGLQNAQARRHLLHDRSQLIRSGSSKFTRPVQQAPASSFSAFSLQSFRGDAKHRTTVRNCAPENPSRDRLCG